MCDTGFAVAVRIRFTRPLLLYQTYTQDWIDYYNHNGFVLQDPTVRWGLGSTGVLRWDTPGLEDPADVLGKARAHGLTNGVALSIGPPEARTISGHTRSSGPFSDEEVARLQDLMEEMHAATDGLDCEDHEESDEVAALRSLEVPQP